jgi:hypothetical protein
MPLSLVPADACRALLRGAQRAAQQARPVLSALAGSPGALEAAAAAVASRVADGALGFARSASAAQWLVGRAARAPTCTLWLLPCSPACRAACARAEPSLLLPPPPQGLAVFLGGQALQFHSHLLLARLGRAGGGRAADEKEHYKIPRGGPLGLAAAVAGGGLLPPLPLPPARPGGCLGLPAYSCVWMPCSAAAVYTVSAAGLTGLLPTCAAASAAGAGGAFELVSCPHYLAEVVLYCGLALLAPSCTAVLALVLVWLVGRGCSALQARCCCCCRRRLAACSCARPQRRP